VGTLTSEGLVRHALERADELDYLGAYISRFDEQALAAAARADAELAAGTDRGPLHGIPVAVKDVIAAQEGPTTAQSRAVDPSWGRGRDAPVVARLRTAGAVIIGKATTMEYALGFPDPTDPYPLPRNPWDTNRWAGGSSSGCANGVAAGLFSAGIGTDTGGSIRVPSAFCGTTGLMPTFGLVPAVGCLPLSYSLDRIGPIARTARDCAAVLNAVREPGPGGNDRADRRGAKSGVVARGSLTGLVIGAVEVCKPDTVHPEVIRCMEAALATLAGLGATITEVELPYYDEMQAVDWLTLVSEAAAYHHDRLLARGSDYSRTTREMISEGLTVRASDYVQAQRVRQVVRRQLDTLFTSVDIVAMPTACGPAPTLRKLFDAASADILAGLNTSYWNPAGNPVLALPMGFTSDHLPLSLQLAAGPFGDDLLLAVGALYQDASAWHTLVPAISPPQDMRTDIPAVGSAERAVLTGRGRAVRIMANSLYSVAEAAEARPDLTFSPKPPHAPW
jgi:aspartyl-tRNA(Asn)/glutamyl-tRNA(Gln) amidotransferase subunit A